MPELPEVETIVRELDRTIAGKNLSRFLVFDKRRLVVPRLRLPQKISSVSRHGKYIVCHANNGLRCLMHLRMTGELLFERQVARGKWPMANRKEQIAKNKHERARFRFSDGTFLRFVDVRRFGTIRWLKNKESLPDLGPDPLSKNFTPKTLGLVLQNSSRAIKSALLDQKMVAGIGNIYADESLWMAKIHPKRKSNNLKLVEVSRLVRAAKQVLREAIRKGGFTLRDYRRIDGSSGYYQKSRKVYDREGQKCLRCVTKIRRIKVGGRSSYFCPKCQKVSQLRFK